MKPTTAQIIEIAKKHGIDVKEDSLTFNESGLDFLVVFATDTEGEKWILRFPRREDVLPSTEKEKRTLDLIEPHLSVQVPKWIVFTNELIAYKQLKGVPAGTIDPVAKAYIWELDEKNVPDLFNKSLAEALVSLHQIHLNEAELAGLTIESAEEARTRMKARMKKVKTEFNVNELLWKRWQAWIVDDALWPKQSGLIHGDLHAGHILIDENSRVTGFIDWTEASVTDISSDFVAHYRTFGEKALEKIISYYEAAGGYVWTNMKKHVIELAAAYPVAIAEFALKSGIEEYKQMARDVLEEKQQPLSK
ncbi:phosphotransferase [Priestia megaterium]|nr:phosphotransferase [Priestia megaterium]